MSKQLMSPHRIDYHLLLTARTPVSHHDPAVQDDSNQQTFNRQKQIVMNPLPAMTCDPEIIARFAEAHPVPVDIAAICADLSFQEFVGAVLVRLFLDMYNNGEGVGVFEGMGRYERLESRLRHAAICGQSLLQMWDRLCDSLNVPIHSGDDDLPLLDALTLPRIVQQSVLRSLVRDYRSIVAVAREWHRVGKLENEAYAERAGMMAMVQPKQVLSPTFNATADRLAVVAEVPQIQTNSLRHQMVREPGWLHLFGFLGLRETAPGQGPVPAGVEAMFYNGGNIASGAKQPTNVFGLSARIRELYPLLDLIGGVTDSFDIGEGRLQMASWLVCRENAEALRRIDGLDSPLLDVSVYEMMDDMTITRHAGQVGQGQMIVGFETLCAGAQVVVRCSLSPFARPETHGALVTALEAWEDNDGTVGGQAARGFGHCTMEYLKKHSWGNDCLAAYLQFLEDHQDEIRDGLVTGTLGTDKVVVS